MTTSETTEWTVRDGRYVGNNGRFWLELRVDLTACGMLSGDVQTAGPPLVTSSSAAREDGAPSAPRGLYASFRSVATPSSQRTEIQWTLPDGSVVPGWVELVSHGAAVRVELALDEPLGSARAGSLTVIDAVRSGDALREVHLEVETEEGVAWPDPRTSEDDRDVQGALRAAGIRMHRAPDSPPVLVPEGGWGESEIFATLHRLMASSTEADLRSPAWELHLLMLSRTNRDELAGVMFDDDALPRQGAAVFVNSIRDALEGQPQAVVDRKIVHTAVHELGHALNLTHRFGREVRRSSSPSFMNYEWRHPAGAQRYWEEFSYRFDEDELVHLRHAPWHQIVPGGAAFGSVRYWPHEFPSDDSTPQEPWSSLQLWLSPPPAGNTFAFGQPVFLEVSLLNRSSETLRLPRHVLDIKAGQLDLVITPADKPVGGDPEALAAAPRFVPVVRRCFTAAAATEPIESIEATESIIVLGPGESIHTNLNLAYGAAMGDVAEPGSWEITPVLYFPPVSSSSGPGNGIDNLVVGRPLGIRVAAPQDRDEERDGETLYRADVRLSLALGGSTALQKAADDLEDLRARRAYRARDGRPDPVAAALARSAGIDQGRRGFRREAAGLLGKATTSSALRAFDPHTAEHTRRLATRYAALADPPVDSTTVVVDLFCRSKEDGRIQGGRGAGFLIVDAPDDDAAKTARPGTRAPLAGPARVVLAPADQLPREALTEGTELGAEVVLTATDGISQRIVAKRVELVGDVEGNPALAVVEWEAGVPGARVPLDAADPARSEARPGLADAFGREGTLGDSLARMPVDQLDDLAQAADGALADVADRPPVEMAASFLRRDRSLDDVAGLLCWLTNRCAAPPRQPPEQPHLPDDPQTPTTPPESPSDPEPPDPEAPYPSAAGKPPPGSDPAPAGHGAASEPSPGPDRTSS